MTDKAKPNLLFVFSDQHRWCDMGYLNPQVHTPHFNEFSQIAARMDGCLSNAPLCVPMRGSLLTGLYPMGHGALTNDLPIRHDVQSIAHVLKNNGYHTGYIGKWHLAGIPRDQYIPQGDGRLGFDHWKVCNCNHQYMDGYYYDKDNRRHDIDGYEPIGQTDLAVDFIEDRHDKPWCLYLSWGPPHDPYRAVPDRYLDRYRDLDVQMRPNIPDVVRHTMRRIVTMDDLIENHRGYYAHITALDEQFGRLMDTLRKTGQMDNTIVVYTSDHGDMLGSQGYTDKQLPYEEAVRVPLLVYWQGKTMQASTDELIGLTDLPVSLLGLMGLGYDRPVHGRDLHRLFTDPDAEGPDACYLFDLIPCHQAMDRGIKSWRGIRTRRYTYARTADDEGFMLYDHTRDPYQINNLIDHPQYLDLKEELMSILDEFTAQYDQRLRWEDLVRQYGYREEWNRSQTYFGLPILD